MMAAENVTGRERASPLVTYDPPALAPRVWGRFGRIAGFAILMAALAGAFSATRPAEYRAQAQLEVGPGAASLVVGADAFSQADRDRMLATQSEILKSARVQEQANRAAKRKLPDAVVTQDADLSNLITVSVTDSSSEEAAAAANTYMDAYLAISRDRVRAQLGPPLAGYRKNLAEQRRNVAAIQQRLSGRAGSLAGTATALQAELNSALAEETITKNSIDRLDGAIRLGGLDARSFAMAVPPQESSGPNPLRMALIAGVLALVLLSLVAAAMPVPSASRSET